MKEITKRNALIYIYIIAFFNLRMMSIKPFAPKFLTNIGGGEFEISLLNALPGIFMIFSVLPGVYLVNKAKNRMRPISLLMLLFSAVPLSFIVVPYLAADSRAMTFILLYSLGVIPYAIYTPSFQSFTGDLFPVYRADVIARANMFSAILNPAFTLVTGFCFHYAEVYQYNKMLLYQIMFVIAFIFGICALYAFNQLVYVPSEEDKSGGFILALKRARKNKPFLRFALASTIFHFGWQMGWSLFSIYTIQVLKADELWLAIISVSSAIVMFFGNRVWPKLINKYGISRISTICTLGMAISPLVYIASKSLMMLLILSSITGVFTSGTLIVLLTDLLEVTPTRNRVVYIGLYNTVTNITLATSPFVAHFIMIHFNIVTALLATSLFRILGSIAFYVRERYELQLEKQG